jgi:uncharacterized protein (TIGR02145 family)
MKKPAHVLELICLFLSIAIIGSCKKEPVVPTLTTTAVTNITINSVTTGGVITSTGGADISARGVCFGTSPSPNIAGLHTSDGNGSGSFTSDLTNLTPNTTYYVRAYATNKAGTAYGSQVSFTTAAIVVPTLTTAGVTSITLTSAVSGGTITADGGGTVTVSGICWATTTGPTADLLTKTTDGTLTGSFTSNLTGLTAGITYYVRAYATNSAGTGYGNEVTFSTTAIVVPTLTTAEVTSITLTTGVSGGNITADGGGAITARGVCWATTANPTLTDSKTTNGTGTGSFASDLTGLTAGTTYHVRAYATNSAGTAYGNEVTFPTTAIVVPTLTTAVVTSITLTSGVSGGNITADGGDAITVRGVCWATTANPTLTDSKTTNGTGTGSFVSNLTGLTAGTTYYVRAYATNSAGTAYGNEVTFPTTAIVVPTLTTDAVTSVTLTTAVAGGNITSDGGGAVSASGVCYATTALPTLSNSFTTDGTPTGSFTSNLTGLTTGTTYYVRAYATNSSGTAYGNQQVFTTVHETGTVTDVDLNTYNTVKIGDQWWMAANLKTTKYNDGTSIPQVSADAAWIALTTGAYCDYLNTSANSDTYGRLYNWFVVDNNPATSAASNGGKNVCPAGWHVPADAEYNTLELYLGLPLAQIDLWGWRGTDQGSQMKSTAGWDAGGNGTNTSGFTGLPAGYRSSVDGTYSALGLIVYWWNSTDDGINGHPDVAWYRRLDGTRSDIYKATSLKKAGVSVRCMKD